MNDFHPVVLFVKGGFFMWPLLLCSVLGLAVILERTLFFVCLLKDANLLKRLKHTLEQPEGLVAARQLVASKTHPIAAVARTYLQNLQRPSALRIELVKSEGSKQLERVENRLRILATISHLTPLLGLLGTVTGLVLAFAQMQTLGTAAKPSDLAGGIWEALLTTVFGLIVAIPCMAAFHGFEGIADRIARRMQTCVVVLDDALDFAVTEDPDDTRFETRSKPAPEGLHTVG